MSICQAIDIQLQKLQAQPNIDTQNISTHQYDQLLDRLNRDVSLLEGIKKILNTPKRHLERLSESISKHNTNIEKLNFSEVLASKPEEIAEGTILFLGNLNFDEYQKINPNKNRLPKNLKIITGDFISENSKLDYLDLDYARSASVSNNNQITEAKFGYVENSTNLSCSTGLKSFSIGYANGYVYLKDCTNLIQARFGVLASKLTLTGCSSLTIDGIAPISDSQPISVEDDIYVGNSGLDRSNIFQIRKKFNIKGESVEIYRGFQSF